MGGGWLWYAWACWWGAILLSFVLLESIAFKYREDGPTLSKFMWTLGSKFPLSIFLMGGLTIGLAVHFYWNWCPLTGSANG